MAGFAVKNPAGHIVHPYQWQAQSDYSDPQSMGEQFIEIGHENVVKINWNS